MKNQSFKNHTRIAYGFYAATGIPTVVLTVLAIKWLFTDFPSKGEATAMLLLISWILLTYLWRVRYFALKAQDRAFRAEESLRYFILTGKRIDQRITLSQIIALRFASDEEFPSLAQQASEHGWSNKEIKSRIRNWRSDWHRV